MSGQLLAFAVLAVMSMVLFRGKLYDRIRAGCRASSTRWRVGSCRSAKTFLAAGRPGSPLQGTQWTAVNVGPAPIMAGARARVVKRDSLDLSIEGLVDDMVNESEEGR